jgi:hypothetical protein
MGVLMGNNGHGGKKYLATGLQRPLLINWSLLKSQKLLLHLNFGTLPESDPFYRLKGK